jgi:hypothetical protein
MLYQQSLEQGIPPNAALAEALLDVIEHRLAIEATVETASAYYRQHHVAARSHGAVAVDTAQTDAMRHFIHHLYAQLAPHAEQAYHLGQVLAAGNYFTNDLQQSLLTAAAQHNATLRQRLAEWATWIDANPLLP